MAVARLSRDEVLRYRIRVSHLDRKLPPGSFAAAAWGGLQDSTPRSGVLSLHARVEGTKPDSWEDPSLVQIWFRGGADYIVPREDVGIFTLGSYPRDPARAEVLERLADEVHRACAGSREPLTGREVGARVGTPPVRLPMVSITGRVHIRWDASQLWVLPVERPAIDVEDARRELARRFLHWFGPTDVTQLARWTGVDARDARETWAGIEQQLEAVDVEGRPGFVLATDLDAFRAHDGVTGVRLPPFEDPLTKLDHELLVPDPSLRSRVLPRPSESPGYIPGAVMVDGEIAGAWQRQQRRVTIHPFRGLSCAVREAVEAEALAFPIAGSKEPTVTWAADPSSPPRRSRKTR